MLELAEPIVKHPTRERLRVCVVTETYPPEINGVALTLARLVDGLRARGHDVSLVRPRQSAADGVRAGDAPGLTLVPGVPLPGYGGLLMGLPATGVLRERWRECPPDAVYVATEGPLGWSAVRAAHALAVPVLSGFHTNFHLYVGHYRGRWLAGGVARYLRRFHNRTSGTVVATADLRDQLEASGFANVHVLGRGIDSRLFSPARRSADLRRAWGTSAGDLVALYVGRLAPEKNVEVAVTAYRAMQAHPRVRRLVLVGDGPVRAVLERAHPDLLFCGAVTGERLAVHYASADVFLFPSETETFGNVTIEALASGLAVVAYDYAAARQHVVHGETGLLVPHGDRAAFIAAAAGLPVRPDLVRMRRRARASVAELGWERVVQRIETLLFAACLASTTGRTRR